MPHHPYLKTRLYTAEQTGSDNKKKLIGYPCPICCEPSYLKIHRSWFLKYVLFFLPLRKYFCPGCKKLYYVNIKRAHGEPVYITLHSSAA
jgi:hypothetical protein